MTSTFPPTKLWYGWEDCGALALARILGWDGSLVTQASITSIAAAVYDLDNGNANTYSATPAASSVIFDTEQNDGSWPYTDGYNFRHLIPSTAFPTGGHRYRIQYLFTPAGSDNQPFAVVFDMVARDLIGS